MTQTAPGQIITSLLTLKSDYMSRLSRLRQLGSRLEPLLTASEEREVTQHVYELMGEAGPEDQGRGDREGLLRQSGDNPRWGA